MADPQAPDPLKITPPPQELDPATLAALMGTPQPQAPPSIPPNAGTSDLESHVPGSTDQAFNDLQSRVPDALSKAIAAKSTPPVDNTGAGDLAESNAANPHPLQSKLGRILGLVGVAGRAMAAGGGSPEQQKIAEEEGQSERQIASNEALRRATLAQTGAYQKGMLGVRQADSDTKSRAQDINQQKADTGSTLADARVPLLNAQTELTGNKQENLDADTAKKNFELETFKAGMFPVDPVTAQLVNRPDLTNKPVSGVLWNEMGKVLAARGLKAVDLGESGYWMIDKEGNKIHQISSTAPSTARAMAFNMFRPVQVVTPEGNLGYQFAKDAIAQGSAPAGPGAQSMSKNAQLDDIQFASGKMRDAIKGLDKPLDATQIGKLTLAMRSTDPTVFQQLKDTLIGSQQLTPAQQDFVTWMQQIHERALSLRNIAGMGNGSDMMREAVANMLPSVKSGSASLMNKQLDAFDNQVKILRSGVPTRQTANQGSGTKTPSTIHSTGSADQDKIVQQLLKEHK